MFVGASSALDVRVGSLTVGKAFQGIVNVYDSGYLYHPSSLFSSGEFGGWFDPAEFRNVFRDVQCKHTASIDNPFVRLMSSAKGYSLGPELFSPTLPASGAIFAPWKYVNGVMQCSGSTYSSPNIKQPHVVVPGLEPMSQYSVTFVVTGTGTAGCSVGSPNVEQGEYVPAGTYTVVTRTVDMRYNGIVFRSGVDFKGSIEVLSIKKMPSLTLDHFLGTARPSLRKHERGFVYADYPSHVSSRVTFFPEPWMGTLGTNCTVAYASPQGAVILTNQVISSSYVFSQDHAGLLIINRPLTLLESVQTTEYLNKKVGWINI